MLHMKQNFDLPQKNQNQENSFTTKKKSMQSISPFQRNRDCSNPDCRRKTSRIKTIETQGSTKAQNLKKVGMFFFNRPPFFGCNEGN